MHWEGNLCEDGTTDELDCGIVLFWEIKAFFFSARLIFFLFPTQVQPNRENTVNIKSIINIYNLHILKILSITKMWGISSQQLVGPDVICMPHTKPQLAIPVLFLTLHACLFSAQIKYRSFVLVEDRCFFFSPPLARTHRHTHTRMLAGTTHRGSIDARCWWRFIIEKEIVSIWLEFVMGGFVLVIYIAGHLCQSALWDLFLLSVFVCVCVCVCSRERVFPLSVVFVSVTVLITNCLIFQLIENRYCSV